VLARLLIPFPGEKLFVFLLDFVVDGHRRFGSLGRGDDGELHLCIRIPCNKQATDICATRRWP
jgi:hypothetical protein